MYEQKKQRLAPTKVYHARIWKNFLVSLFILAICLMIGIIGYRITVPTFDWYDCLLNASMILSGMGPVFGPDDILSPAAKIFASFYALFSGITFIGTIGLLIAPIAHRFFHKLHLEDTSRDNE